MKVHIKAPWIPPKTGTLLMSIPKSSLLENTNKYKQTKSPPEPSCKICSKETELVCSKCEKVRYCNKECQGLDWPMHKETCGLEDKSRK